MTGFQAAHFFFFSSAPCFGTRSQLIVKFLGFRWSLEGEVEEEMARERVQHCWLSCAIRSNPRLPFSIPASHLCTPSSLHVLTTVSGRLNVPGISWFDGGRTGVGVSWTSVRWRHSERNKWKGNTVNPNLRWCQGKCICAIVCSFFRMSVYILCLLLFDLISLIASQWAVWALVFGLHLD